ncbi:hypothetical protein Tco_0937564 [Tanacetum coccineum]|uniref:Uncharacterized protein n=1 Tax=Tanacetum coccineum TaxID=301880 RepID=A0ABQ5DFC9_9ASTR
MQPLPTINPKDKGKGVLVEEEPEKPEKVKRRDQGMDADHKLASDDEEFNRKMHQTLEEYDIWDYGLKLYLEYIEMMFRVIQNWKLSRREFHMEKDGLKISCDGHFPSSICEDFHGMDDEKSDREASELVSSEKVFRKGIVIFQQLLSQLEAHGAEVSTKDANYKVFEQEIQGASKTSSSAQNVAFVSQSKSNTNKVKSGLTIPYSTCTPSTSSTNILEK